MKKLIVIFAVLLFVAPAFAADWSFYGSQRVATWYNSRDYGDFEVNGDSNDAGTTWYLQGNSRFGAKVKADKVSGQIELGLKASTGSGEDQEVGTRRAYGVWKFSDNAALKVGKDYSPVTDFISNQWYNDDGDLLGEGNFYGKRPAGLTLILGGLELAFLSPQQGNTGGINSSTTGILTPVTNRTSAALGTGQTNVTGDPDVYFPKVEASFNIPFGSSYIKPYAGGQYYQVKSYTGSGVTDDIDIYSYVVGVSASFNIGAFSLGGQVNYGMNEGISNWANGYNVGNAQLPVLKAGGDDIADIYTTQALLVAALKFTDTLRFEVGAGYRMDNADKAPGYSQKDESWAGYVQAMITMAPGVYLCPEIGYIDYMDSRAGEDEGYAWYAGAKWQIDF